MGKKRAINLKEYLIFLKGHKKQIIRSTILLTAFGFFLAITGQKEYQVETSLLPTIYDETGNANDLLKTFGGLAGINLNLGQDRLISPDLYPQIVQSTPFMLEILKSNVDFVKYDTTVTVFNFFTEIKNKPPLEFIAENTIELPFTILSLFRKDESRYVNAQDKSMDNVIIIDRKHEKLIASLKKRILVYVDDESGVITLDTEFPDPKAATEISQMVIKKLTEYVINYKTEQLNEELNFIEQRLKEAQNEFEESQYKLARFEDENLNLSTALASSRKRKLESDYNIKFGLYSTLSQQYEQAKIQKQRRTPIFQVLEPVKYPLKKSKPRRILIVIGFFMLGGILSVLYFSLKRYKSLFIDAILP